MFFTFNIGVFTFNIGVFIFNIGVWNLMQMSCELDSSVDVGSSTQTFYQPFSIFSLIEHVGQHSYLARSPGT